jgi:formylglycine-generating enzyme required for sulfatase activity
MTQIVTQADPRIRLWLVIFSLLSALASPASAQEPAAASEPPEIVNSIGMKLVRIKAGRFSRGSPNNEPGSFPNESLHKVEISRPFYMGTLEVTEKQYAEVLQLQPQLIEEKNQNGRVTGRKSVPFSDKPVFGIEWFDAREFCKLLSERPEEKKAGRKYRLPTEAEWEYACRAGTTTAYSFGNDPARLGDYAWYAKNARGINPERVQPGGQKKPNPWGLYDMHGNVPEWCEDLYVAQYPQGTVTDPCVRPRGSVMIMALVVARGGGYNSDAPLCRSAYRMSRYADDPGGFRVVMEPEQAGEAAE